jgi:TetR/AcrR family transcriptional repressor of nem operon
MMHKIGFRLCRVKGGRAKLDSRKPMSSRNRHLDFYSADVPKPKFRLHLTNRSTKVLVMKADMSTRQKLLTTAIDLIWENSYGSISVDEICTKAGINKGSFYYAFKSKSDLAVAAFDLHWESKLAAMDEVFSSQIAPLVRIEGYINLVIRVQLEKFQRSGKILGCPFCSVGSELSTQDEKIRIKAKDMSDRTIRYLSAAVRDAIVEHSVESQDPKQIAEEIFYYITGLLTQAKIANDPAILDRLAPGVFRLLNLEIEPALI